MFTAQDVYNMFFSTISAVYDFLRKAEFMGVSLLSLSVTCIVLGAVIVGIVNVVQRAPVETGTSANNRIRSNRRREEAFHHSERRHRERMDQNERLRRRK